MVATITDHDPDASAASDGPSRRALLASRGWVAVAVDGSRIDLPRAEANERAFGCAGKKKTNPQAWITTLWHIGLGLPWAGGVLAVCPFFTHAISVEPPDASPHPRCYNVCATTRAGGDAGLPRNARRRRS